MFALDDLTVISRAQVPIEVFREMQSKPLDLEQLVYVGVDTDNLHCYLRPDNTFLRLPKRIEENYATEEI